MDIQLIEHFLFPFFFTSSLFIAMIYFGQEKKKSYLYFLLHVIFLSCAILSQTNHAKLLFIVFLFLSLNALILFLMEFHEYDDKNIIYLSIASIGFTLYKGQALGEHYYIMSWFAYYLSLLFLTFISISALKKKLPFSKTIFTIISLILLMNSILITHFPFLHLTYFSGVLFILVFIFILLRDFKNRSMLLTMLQKRTITLENEMLKKSIQPHFLLNTLTIISEWIETKPTIALEQIKLLSYEFRYIVKASNVKYVSIHEEICLCENYLKMINMRQESNFTFKHSLENLSIKIPPLIFHSIVENGIIHSDNSDMTEFFLSCEECSEMYIFTLVSPGKVTHSNPKEGLGTQYIKSKLDVLYNGKWTFSQNEVNGSWHTKIGIPK